MGSTAQIPPEETALREFLAPMPEGLAVQVRTLAHAWGHAGGKIQVGKLCVRLLAQGSGKRFTAGTLHGGGRLELSKVLILTNGLDEERWDSWCDERPDLQGAGFEGDSKYPSITLAKLNEMALARLALGLRDLVILLQGPAA